MTTDAAVKSSVRIVDHPAIRTKVTQLRSHTTGAHAFRDLIEELGTLLIYEASRSLKLRDVTVETPLAPATGSAIAPRIGLIPILRAGTGLLQGALHVFPDAQVWHLGVYRDEHRLVPVEYYNRLPPHPTVDVCFILDPMLATGGSALSATDVLLRWGVEDIRFVGIIGAPEGITAFTARYPQIPVTLAAIDDCLNHRGFIVPGLGDAGDRQFGTGA